MEVESCKCNHFPNPPHRSNVRTGLLNEGQDCHWYRTLNSDCQGHAIWSLKTLVLLSHLYLSSLLRNTIRWRSNLLNQDYYRHMRDKKLYMRNFCVYLLKILSILIFMHTWLQLPVLSPPSENELRNWQLRPSWIIGHYIQGLLHGLLPNRYSAR